MHSGRAVHHSDRPPLTIVASAGTLDTPAPRQRRALLCPVKLSRSPYIVPPSTNGDAHAMSDDNKDMENTTPPVSPVYEAKILFRQLKPFPVIDENNNFKIETEHFLDSANQIIDAIACFGKLFSPIVRDMRQNVQKITNKYNKNETLFKYLEDLILKDKDGNDNPFDTVTDGLLWLKRAFEMIEQFFRNVLEDETCSEQVKPHLKKAYEECLLPYHGFVAQKAFQLLQLYLPSRTSLLGPADSNMDNLKALEEFLTLFRTNLNHLNEFYTKHDLHRTYKA
uniref:Glycolipid transfer protein domain-containing protein n=1 Tax=Anopheles farauti TaxID=69004 RepID=A0A182Q7U5_9DIPT